MTRLFVFMTFFLSSITYAQDAIYTGFFS
ncbi:MAG: hypothetical protein ACI8Q3_001121, partial [Marinomonas primoryensis]